MFQRPINRVEPQMPAAAYKTYTLAAPLATHWRKATCAEVGCPDYLNGWRVRVEGLDAQMLHDARRYGRNRELPVTEGETWLVYEAGQPCFRSAQHRTRIERPELYLVRDGDWRGNPRGTQARQHSRPEHWVEDFAEHQQGLADTAQKG